MVTKRSPRPVGQALGDNGHYEETELAPALTVAGGQGTGSLGERSHYIIK